MGRKETTVNEYLASEKQTSCLQNKSSVHACVWKGADRIILAMKIPQQIG